MSTAHANFGSLDFFQEEIEKLNSDYERISHINLLDKIESLQDETESKDYWHYLELIRLEVMDSGLSMQKLKESEITFEDFVSIQPSPMYWQTISQLLKMPLNFFSRIIGANNSSIPLGGSAYAFHLNSSFKSDDQRKAVQEFIDTLKSKGDSTEC